MDPFDFFSFCILGWDQCLFMMINFFYFASLFSDCFILFSFLFVMLFTFFFFLVCFNQYSFIFCACCFAKELFFFFLLFLETATLLPWQAKNMLCLSFVLVLRFLVVIASFVSLVCFLFYPSMVYFQCCFFVAIIFAHVLIILFSSLVVSFCVSFFFLWDWSILIEVKKNILKFLVLCCHEHTLSDMDKKTCFDNEESLNV